MPANTSDKPRGRTSHVCSLTTDQAAQLKDILVAQDWQFAQPPHTIWQARKLKTSATAYLSGKLSIQGKGTEELVQFILEPEILKEARFGYEQELAESENPAMFQPHGGIDESGKGDYFGPLVIAAVFVDENSARALLEAGIQDSKAIKSAKKIVEYAKLIRSTTAGGFAVVSIGPEAYNRMYARIQNVNRLLAWGHARALENLLEKRPQCKRAVSDQFGRKSTVLQALKEKGRKIELEQRHKAESDIAVAAASILARDEFVRRLQQLSEIAKVTFPKGASSKVLECAAKFISDHGEDELHKFAKVHFQTTIKAKAMIGR